MVVPPTPLHTSRVLTEDMELWDDVKVSLRSASVGSWSGCGHKVAERKKTPASWQQTVPTGGNDQRSGHHASGLRAGEDQGPGHVQQPSAEQETQEAERCWERRGGWKCGGTLSKRSWTGWTTWGKWFQHKSRVKVSTRECLCPSTCNLFYCMCFFFVSSHSAIQRITFIFQESLLLPIQIHFFIQLFVSVFNQTRIFYVKLGGFDAAREQGVKLN